MDNVIQTVVVSLVGGFIGHALHVGWEKRQRRWTVYELWMKAVATLQVDPADKAAKMAMRQALRLMLIASSPRVIESALVAAGHFMPDGDRLFDAANRRTDLAAAVWAMRCDIESIPVLSWVRERKKIRRHVEAIHGPIPMQ